MNLMRKTLTITGLLLIFWFSSCNIENKNKAELLFESYKFSDKVYLFDNENYPSSQIDIRIDLPSDSVYYKVLSETILSEFFDSIYRPNLPVNDMLYKAFEHYSLEYKDMEEFYQEDSIDAGATYNWEIINQSVNEYKVGNFLTFMNEVYAYTGGAHGNTTRYYYVYDLNQNKVLKANEVFNLDKCNEILELQKKSLSEIEDLENLWLDGLKCNDNFYVVESGFIFHYDQYEIAPYAAGPMDVFINFKDLEPYLLRPELFTILKKE